MSNTKFLKIGSIEYRTIEECSELIQEICKAKRFGYDASHPNDLGRMNAQRVYDEIQDVRQCINELEKQLLDSDIRILTAFRKYQDRRIEKEE